MLIEKSNFRKKSTHQKAFTLAEVLITLVIIGVIAAITIPVLMENHKKQETLSRLKKAYSVLSQGLRKSQYENGPFSEWPPTNKMTDVDAFFNQYWRPYFSHLTQHDNAKDLGYSTNFCWKNVNGERIGWNVSTSESRMLVSMNDGTLIFFPRNTTNAQGQPSYVNYFYVDINGASEPNIIGRDVFIFQMVDYDNLKPYCYSRSYDDINTNCKRNMSGNNSNCCTAKIMLDGWQFKNDYPW